MASRYDSHDEQVKSVTLHSLGQRLVNLSSAEVDISTLDDKLSRLLYHSLAKPSQKSNAPTILFVSLDSDLVWYMACCVKG